MKKLFVIVISFFCLINLSLLAQTVTPELVTDRPDQTESALVVPENTYQIETGFSFQKQKYFEGELNIENDNISFASTLIRYGINDIIEMRLGGEYFLGKSTIDGVESTISGIQEMYMGAKIQLWRNKLFLTDAALLINLFMPFGNERLRPEKFEPGIALAVSRDLFEGFSLGINFGAQNSSETSNNIYFYTSAIGIELTEKLGCFVEIFGDVTKNSRANHFIDAGFTYLQMKNLQVDLSAGSILFSDNADWFVGMGISVRLPK